MLPITYIGEQIRLRNLRRAAVAVLVSCAPVAAGAQCGKSNATVSLHAKILPATSDKAPGTFLCRVDGPAGVTLEAFSDRSETPEQRANGPLTVHYRISRGKTVLGLFTLSSVVEPEVIFADSGSWVSVTGAPGANGPFIPRIFKLSATAAPISNILGTALAQFASDLPLCLVNGKDRFCDPPELHKILLHSMPDWLDIWPLAFDERTKTMPVLLHVPGSPRYGANVGQSWIYVVSLDDGKVTGVSTGTDAERRFARDLRNAKAYMEPE